MSTPAEQAQLLAEDNDDRVSVLENKTAGPGSMENAFDALKMLTYLDNIVLALGIADQARLDFEGRKARMLSLIEVKVTEFSEAREAAERQARVSSWAGGPIGIRGGVPMRPGPGGVVRPT
jgi:hypothetical protein